MAQSVQACAGRACNPPALLPSPGALSSPTHHQSHSHSPTAIRLPACWKTQIPPALELSISLGSTTPLLLSALHAIPTTFQAEADTSHPHGARQAHSRVWGHRPVPRARPARLPQYHVLARGPEGTRPSRGLTGGRFCGNIFGTGQAQDPSRRSGPHHGLRPGT